MTGGIGHGPNRTGVCADPHFRNKTISCRTYFTVMGMLLRRMRKSIDLKEKTGASTKQRRKLSDESRQQLTAHVENSLDKTCCARFESDGRVECGKKYCELHSTQESAKRAAHILLRMENNPKHRPSTHRALSPDISAVIENIVLPEVHYDPQCKMINRTTLAHGGPTRWECMGKSFIHHASKRYGMDPETVTDRMNKMGFSAGQSLQSFQRAAGMFREVRSSGDVLTKRTGKKAQKKAVASKKAGELLRKYGGRADGLRRLQEEQTPTFASDEEEAKYATVTRGTSLNDKPKTHGFAHAAKTIVDNRNANRNITNALKAHFRRVEHIQHSDRLKREASGRAGMSRFDVAPKASSFHLDNIRQHLFSPALSFEVLQADEGSFSSRFRKGALHLNDVFSRWQGAHYAANLAELQRRRKRSRRLSDSKTETERRQMAMLMYDELERQEVARHKKRVQGLLNTTEGRRLNPTELHERTKADHFQLPNEHPFSWVHELVDWSAVSDEWHRLHDIFTKRNDMRMHGRNMKTILEGHPTGYAFLDDHRRFGFSQVGDAIRRVWHRKVNGTDQPFVDHVNSKEDKAGKHHPPSHGRLRRLSESFLGPVVRVPYTLFDTVLFRGTHRQYATAASRENVFVAAIRYLVYSTIGCYLVKPKEFAVSTQSDDLNNPGQSVDGARLKVLRVDATRVCFPAIPLVVPTLPTFREFTKSQGIDYKTLTYEEFCSSEGYQQKARDFVEQFLGMKIHSENARWLGVTGFLRGAEAMDSVKNFVDSANADTGEWLIGFILCGIVELGGVIYVMVVLVILTIALPLIQMLNILVGVAFDVGVLLAATTENYKDGTKASRGPESDALGQSAVEAVRTGLGAPSGKKPPLPGGLKRRARRSLLVDCKPNRYAGPYGPTEPAVPLPTLLNGHMGSSQLLETQGAAKDAIDDHLLKTAPPTGIFTAVFQYAMSRLRPNCTISKRAPYDEVSTTTDEDEKHGSAHVDKLRAGADTIPQSYEYPFDSNAFRDNVV